MIDYINRTRHDHIITIEDPIEFVHQNQKCLINQREVRTHTDSFKDALARGAARGSGHRAGRRAARPRDRRHRHRDGRDGHLVFGTLHTTTAASTVDRIIDQFPSDRQAQIRIMLSESLRGVIAQTLCRKIGGGRVAALEVLIVDAGDQQPDSRGQDVPDSVDDAGRASRRHGDAERRADGAGDARSSSRPTRRTPRPWTRPASRRCSSAPASRPLPNSLTFSLLSGRSLPHAGARRPATPGGDAMKGFKEFLLRGNVLDLAVAVVIGGAFGAIVTRSSRTC